MILDVKFVIFGTLIIAGIIPLYIYREKFFSFAYKKGSIELFIQDIQVHMNRYYPKIKFDYSVINNTKDEKDIRIRETLIVEDIVNQFYYYDYEKKTQGSVSKDKLWSTYTQYNKSSNKTPNDWSRRKELAWNRDNQKCNRCGIKSKLNDTYTSFVKDIQDGGGYNLENIVILCSDCNRILNSTNPKNTISSLGLNDKLMVFVED